jgi:hypothetical protein
VTGVSHVLSPDRRQLVIVHRVPTGLFTTTLDFAEPATDEQVARALADRPGPNSMIPGQSRRTRRLPIRWRSREIGTVFVTVLSGPPTWWWPRVYRADDGTPVIGWLRRAVAVGFAR